jgi:hypothetical protein
VELGPGDHDYTGIFTATSTDADAKLAAAQTAVTRLRGAKAEADAELKQALDARDGRDLNAPARTVRQLEREVANAELELEEAEAIVTAWEREGKRQRFAAITEDLRATREKFAAHYREAALALGRWYMLGTEVSELAASLADRIGNGAVYHPPELKDVMAAANTDPNPLPALRDSGLREIQTVASFRRHISIVPLIGPGKYK